jgi:ribosomal protein S18 acetylase RimI-like enzyme
MEEVPPEVGWPVGQPKARCTLESMTSRKSTPAPRRATVDDAPAIGRLFTDFNTEFDEPTPPAEVAAGRAAEHIEREHSLFLLIGDGPDGFAQLRFQPSLYAEGLECLLQELYIVPDRRGKGLGRALLDAALDAARAEGADYISLGTSEDDVAARALYESAGFTNREHPPDGPVMYVYEREL